MDGHCCHFDLVTLMHKQSNVHYKATKCMPYLKIILQLVYLLFFLHLNTRKHLKFTHMPYKITVTSDAAFKEILIHTFGLKQCTLC